jgi:O-antigen/teichoic acid export membrane protein
MTSRDIWQSLGTRFGVVALGTSSSILMTRALGPEARGLYMGVMSIAALGIQLGTLGLGSSNTYYLSGRREAGQALATNTFTIGLVLGAVLSVAGWFVADHVHGLRASAGNASLVMALVSIPVGLLLFFGQNLQLATHDTRNFNRIELVRGLCGLALVLSLLSGLHRGYPTAIGINLALSAAATTWIWWKLAGTAALRPCLGWDGALFSRTFGYGFKAFTITFLGYLVLRLDALLVQNWRGAVDAGQYGVAVQMGDLLMTVSTTVAMIMFPKVAELGKDAWPLIRRITVATGAALGAACVVAYGLAPFAVRIVFGPAFLPAAMALRALLPGIWCLSIEVLLVQYLNGLGMPAMIIWGWLVALALNVYLNWLWIPSCGIEGAGWASTAAYSVVTAFVALLVLHRRRKDDAESAAAPNAATALAVGGRHA